MSLIWHGLWTGYAIVFIGSAFADIIYKNLSKTKMVNSITEMLPRPVYLLFWFPLHRFILSWITFPFHFQYWAMYSKVYSSMGNIGWWLLLAMFAGMYVLPRKRTEKAKEAEKVKAQ